MEWKDRVHHVTHQFITATDQSMVNCLRHYEKHSPDREAMILADAHIIGTLFAVSVGYLVSLGFDKETLESHFKLAVETSLKAKADNAVSSLVNTHSKDPINA